jgi:VCBS repeat-containing protein
MGLTVSYLNTPQAVDDTFTISAADLTVKQFDVMANDSGGKAKTLYSLDGGEVSSDLLVRDTAKGSELSAKGATIWMTTDGKLAYDASALAEQLGRLAEGEIFEDSFSYAIQLGNGTLSVATAIVRIVGVNDAPMAAADGNAAVEDGSAVTGSVAANDGDADNGAQLTYALDAAVVGLAFNADGSYVFDASDAAYQDLAEGQTIDVEATYTVTDEFGASASSKLTISVTGTADGVPSLAVDDTVITNITSGAIVIPDSALLANDSGDELTIEGVTGPEASLTASGDVVFTDEGTAGGSFEYLVEGDSAQVTVQVQEGMWINGTAEGEILVGASGNDRLYGNGGDDFLIGGVGPDQMTGGAGADLFVYRAGDIDVWQGADLIWDFNPAEGDRLDLRDLLSGWGLQDPSQIDKYVDFVATSNGNSQMNVDAPGDVFGFSSAIAFMGVDLSLLNTADFVIL